MPTRYEVVIGLEVHAQLLTQSKLFCGCSTRFGQLPNSNVCPVCLGLPGSLPVLNGQAVRLALRAALALGCTVHETSIFARKNYFYPDLPKGYQISQYEEPLATDGWLDIEGESGPKRIRIHRIHMEEDAGKNVHGMGGDSLVDLNRAGTPLVEIVSEPDLRSSSDAAAYMRALRDVLLFLRANDGNLEEGSLRCDANVSIRPFGQKELGTRCELKNINSFKFVQKAIDSEVARQIAVVEGGGRIIQQTRSFDPDTGTTHTLRSKEEAHDYRYFPEPDLPPLFVPGSLVAEERSRLSPLPAALRQTYVNSYGLSTQAAATLTQHPGFVAYFEAVRSTFDQPTKVANYMLTEVMRGASVHGLAANFNVTPAQVAELLQLVQLGRHQRQTSQRGASGDREFHAYAQRNRGGAQHEGCQRFGQPRAAVRGDSRQEPVASAAIPLGQKGRARVSSGASHEIYGGLGGSQARQRDSRSTSRTKLSAP